MGASRGHSQVACLRSYEDPSGRPDTLTNHEWSILDAAMATCARHPYSAPQQIYDDTDHSTLTCRDPALMGYSNPIHLATAEAHSLFEEKEAVYISIGSGRVCSSEIDQTRVVRFLCSFKRDIPVDVFTYHVSVPSWNVG